MLSYCLKCKKNKKQIQKRNNKTKQNKKETKKKIINSVNSKTIDGRTMTLSKCAICSAKKSRFIKKHEARGIVRNLGRKTQLNKIPLFGDILF